VKKYQLHDGHGQVDFVLMIQDVMLIYQIEFDDVVHVDDDNDEQDLFDLQMILNIQDIDDD
jgi:hypothetical protein